MRGVLQTTKKTDWVTHEYHLCQKELDGNNLDQVGCLSRLLFLLALHFFLIVLFLLANFGAFTITSSELLSFNVFVQNTKIMSHTMHKIPDPTSSTQLKTQRILLTVAGPRVGFLQPRVCGSGCQNDQFSARPDPYSPLMSTV
jgi:hypothetical protein